MKKILALSVIATMAIIGCNLNKKPPTAEFWPFAVGNQWTTAEDFSYTVKNVTSGSKQSTTTNTVEAFIKRKDGKQLWPINSKITQGDSVINTVSYYYVTEDSVYTFSALDAKDPQSVEPNKLKVGMEWDGALVIPIEIPNFETTLDAKFKVIASQKVTVKAGTFDALLVKVSLPQYDIDSAATQWRVKGKGIVKMDANFTATYSFGGLKFNVDIKGSSEMQSYSFK